MLLIFVLPNALSLTGSVKYTFPANKKEEIKSHDDWIVNNTGHW